MGNVMEKMPSHIGPGEFWEAVLHRDRRFQYLFVYAVRSTGVYCRPTCASRRPRREQVSFFAGPEAAERAQQVRRMARQNTPGRIIAKNAVAHGDVIAAFDP